MKQKQFIDYKDSEKGFTLIELLVVISIISLLASILAVSINNARVGARNAKRIVDGEALQEAFNLALSNGGTLPSTVGDPYSSACISSSCYGTNSGYIADTGVTAFLSPYLSQYPTDPPDNNRALGGYIYESQFSGATTTTGSVIPPGPIIFYTQEITQSPPSCGTGFYYNRNLIKNVDTCLLIIQ